MCVCACVHAFFCACVRACVRVCVCVCACVRRFVHVYTICGTSLYRPKERPELSVAFEFDPWTSFYNYMTTLGEKKLVRKEFANSFTCRTPFKAICFVCVWGGIREVQESVSERIEKVPGRYMDGTLNISRVAEIGKQRLAIV